jgi:predicted DNA-binding transcriptional regulator AlpA
MHTATGRLLADYPDVLSIHDLCVLLAISRSQYYALKQHGVFPIAPLSGLGGAIRYSKASVQQYLESGCRLKLRRVG